MANRYFPPPPTFWTPERQAELERLWSEGATDEQLARHFGRSRYGIQNQRWKLGLALNGTMRPRLMPWPDMAKDAFR